MCGRTSCNCQPEIYVKASSYKNAKTGKYVIPEWKDVPGHEFKPSPNIAPTDFTPVILNYESKRILQPMMWGMIPPWHEGDYKTHGLKTNNCRIENITKSSLYSPCLKKGKRCVIICDGFYEWQTKAGKKKPYFIYSTQKDNVKVENKKLWELATWDEEIGWTGPNLTKLAGLYNEWHSPENKILYSYTIITMESNQALSWLHHRMPAILNEDQLTGWLDIEGVNSKDAINLLTPVGSVSYHPVSDIVNNSRNKDETCNKPIIESKKTTASSSFMQNWLKRAQTSPESSNGKEKKPKY